MIIYRVSSKSLVWLFSTVCFQNSPTRWVGGDSPKRGTHWLETEAGREGSCVDQVLLVDHQMSFLVLVFGSGSQRWSSDVLFGFWTRLDELFSTPSIFLSWDLQRCRSGQGRPGRAIPPLPSSVSTLHSGLIWGCQVPHLSSLAFPRASRLGNLTIILSRSYQSIDKIDKERDKSESLSSF